MFLKGHITQDLEPILNDLFILGKVQLLALLLANIPDDYLGIFF